MAIATEQLQITQMKEQLKLSYKGKYIKNQIELIAEQE